MAKKQTTTKKTATRSGRKVKISDDYIETFQEVINGENGAKYWNKSELWLMINWSLEQKGVDPKKLISFKTFQEWENNKDHYAKSNPENAVLFERFSLLLKIALSGIKRDQLQRLQGENIYTEEKLNELYNSKDPADKAEYQRAKKILADGKNGLWQRHAWYVERMFDDFNKVEKKEQTNKDEDPLANLDLSKLSNEELEKFNAFLEKASKTNEE